MEVCVEKNISSYDGCSSSNKGQNESTQENDRNQKVFFWPVLFIIDLVLFSCCSLLVSFQSDVILLNCKRIVRDLLSRLLFNLRYGAKCHIYKTKSMLRLPKCQSRVLLSFVDPERDQSLFYKKEELPPVIGSHVC